MSSKLTALTTNPSPLATDLLYVVPAAGGNQYKAAVSAYTGSLVVGPASATNNAIAVYDTTTGKLIKNSTLVYDGTQQVFPSTATGGIQLYNTADQTTNYERGDLFWNSNTLILRASQGGTGTFRTLQLGVNSLPTYQLKPGGSTTGQHTFTAVSSGNTADIHFNFTGGISTATSGTPIGFRITPTYNQASGTAANTDLLVNRTQTAVGSGTQRLIDLQVGGASMFSVSNTGVVTRPGGTIPLLTTSTAVTSGAGASAGTLTNAPSAGNPTCWIPFNDNGTTRYIPAW